MQARDYLCDMILSYRNFPLVPDRSLFSFLLNYSTEAYNRPGTQKKAIKKHSIKLDNPRGMYRSNKVNGTETKFVINVILI